MSQRAPTVALLAEFDRLHVETLGVRAVIHGGKDAKLLASLWRSHGALVTDLMVDFFASDDSWIRAHGYTVGMFVSQAGKLIARRALKPKLRTSTPRSAGMDWYDDCKARHGGDCDGQYKHRLRVEREEMADGDR